MSEQRSQVPATFTQVLRQRARRQPDQPALSFLLADEREETLTYAELDRRARSVAAALQGKAAAGDRVLLLYPPGLEYVTALFGCFYAGCVAVPAYPPRRNRKFSRLESMVAAAGASAALTTPTILSLAKDAFADNGNGRRFNWLVTGEIPLEGAEQWQDPALTGDSLALLQFTSGSTDTPRGVMVTHANLLNNSEIICQSFGHTSTSQGVIWLPPYHDMGLIGGILQPVYAGFPCTLMSPIAFLQRPIRWLRAVSRYGGTTSGGPNFAYDLCLQRIKPDQRKELDLSSWTVAFNGAEPIDWQTLDRFAEFFAPCGFRREALYPCYGLAEATLMVTGGARLTPPTARTINGTALQQNRVVPASQANADARKVVSCGCPNAQHQVTIVDPETHKQRAPGEVGEIWVSGPSVAKGYWGLSHETERTFGARVADNGAEPFLRTGDLGMMLDGELFVTGRLKDMLIIRGRNYYPHDIERTVRACHAALRVGDGAAFTIAADGKEQLAIAQEVDQRATCDFNKLLLTVRRRVAQAHQLQVHAVVLLPLGKLPKTSSGKIQRHRCRQGFLKSEWETVFQWRLEQASQQPVTGVTDLPSHLPVGVGAGMVTGEAD